MYHQESNSKLLINKFIQDVNKNFYDSLQGYTKPLKCTHFYHEECKNIYTKKYTKNKNFHCLLCEYHITLKDFYLFGPIKNSNFLSLIEKYNYIETESDYIVAQFFSSMELTLEKKIVPMFYDQNTRDKL